MRFFATLNAVKLIPYFALGQLDLSNLKTSATLFPLAMVATACGAWTVRRMKPQVFYPFMYTMAFLAGSKLVWDGFQSHRIGRSVAGAGCAKHIPHRTNFLALRGNSPTSAHDDRRTPFDAIAIRTGAICWGTQAPRPRTVNELAEVCISPAPSPSI